MDKLSEFHIINYLRLFAAPVNPFTTVGEISGLSYFERKEVNEPMIVL